MYRIINALEATEALILFAWEEEGYDETTRNITKEWQSLLSNSHSVGDFEGKKGQTCLLYTGQEEMPRILVMGLGRRNDLSIRMWKQAVGTATTLLQNKKASRLSFVFPEEVQEKFGYQKVSRETVLSVEIAAYSFDEYKKPENKVVSITDVSFYANGSIIDRKEMEKGLKLGETVGKAINRSRTLGNTPPSEMTPSYLAKEAMSLDQNFDRITTKVLSRPEMESLGMGCLLGVARGSVEEPKFIILEYFAGKEDEKPTVLVGKGVTFDSGGLSIKPGNYMVDMKFDMLGAATVLGIMRSVAGIGLQKNIIALIPTCENMPGGNAYRPDDILTAMNGKTIEIANTDAEGRLILADALSYASRYNPKEVIDFATLTGACLVAIGNERSGLFTEDEDKAKALRDSADNVGEQLWHLPLGEEYSEALKSDIADIRNIGGVNNPGFGGASTAAAFLQSFTDYPWTHIDLSCSYYPKKGKAWIRSGANGFGIQTILAYLSKN